MPGYAKLCIAAAVVLLLMAVAMPAQAAERELATDRPGNDLRAFELTAPLPDQCEQACNEDPQCLAWTFAWPGKRAGRAHCSLKSAASEKKADNCCISGLRTELETREPAQSEAEPPEQAQAAAPEPPEAEPEAAPAPVDLAAACESYAKQAVAMNEENETLFCNLSGSRWGYSYERYHNWCMTKSTAASRKSNTDARAEAIDRCRVEIGFMSEEETIQGRLAAQEKACKAYAERSTQQATEARQNQCGVSGPRWLTAHQPHFSWCMTVSKAERQSELQQRNIALAECTAQRAASLECDDYARIALAQAREADERRCGFAGRRWTRNYGAHKNWCRNANTKLLADETRTRATALNACRGRPRVAQACSRFAARAVVTSQMNIDRTCGYQGPRWSLDRDRHFLWCMDVKPHQRRRERGNRIKALKQCGVGKFTAEPGAPQTGFEYRWRKVAGPGGEWSSQWIAARRAPRCEHLVRGCQCGAANYCGNYRAGEVALWWSNGCISRPWEILCEVRPRR